MAIYVYVYIHLNGVLVALLCALKPCEGLQMPLGTDMESAIANKCITDRLEFTDIGRHYTYNQSVHSDSCGVLDCVHLKPISMEIHVHVPLIAKSDTAHVYLAQL